MHPPNAVLQTFSARRLEHLLLLFFSACVFFPLSSSYYCGRMCESCLCLHKAQLGKIKTQPLNTSGISNLSRTSVSIDLPSLRNGEGVCYLLCRCRWIAGKGKRCQVLVPSSRTFLRDEILFLQDHDATHRDRVRARAARLIVRN